MVCESCARITAIICTNNSHCMHKWQPLYAKWQLLFICLQSLGCKCQCTTECHGTWGCCCWVVVVMLLDAMAVVKAMMWWWVWVVVHGCHWLGWLGNVAGSVSKAACPHCCPWSSVIMVFVSSSVVHCHCGHPSSLWSSVVAATSCCCCLPVHLHCHCVAIVMCCCHCCVTSSSPKV